MTGYGSGYCNYKGNFCDEEKRGHFCHGFCHLKEQADDYASSLIDSATQKRVEAMLKRGKRVPEEVYFLCYELMDNYIAEAKVRGISSRSQSVDGVSESETYKSIAEKEEEIEALIFRYLGNVTDDNGTPLLYRGCSV